MPKWGNSRLGPEKPNWIRRSHLPGSTLGRFQILGELGTGATGVVYAAYDPERDQNVALKVLGDDKKRSAAALARFRQEFAALARLAHPNLVQLHEIEEDGHTSFFTMEAVRGCDPISYIRTGIVEDEPWPDLPPAGARPQKAPLCTTSQYARLREILGQVASGLIALHRGGMVHRDIKPHNVLVTREGRAVVLDFGLMIDLSSRLSNHEPSDTEVVGTAAYMAPEQAAGVPVDAAADWYSFGVFVYEAVSGVWPFDGPPIRMLMRKQTEQAPSLREMVPDAPSDLTSLCAALLEPDPRDRPAGEEILSILGGRSAGIETEVETQDMPPFVGRHTEIGHLEQAFGESHGRRPVTMVLRGAPGAGKTELARRFLDRVDADFNDVAILRGRCHEHEQVAYKALDGVIADIIRLLRRLDPAEAAALLPEDAPLLARLFPALKRLPVVARMPIKTAIDRDVRAQRTRAFAAFAELLKRLTERWRLLVFIDDLQWADGDSLALLSQTMSTANYVGFMLLVTVRADNSGEVPPRVAQALATMEQVRVLHLQSLPMDEATHLAHLLHRRVTGKHASALLAQSVADESSGYPLVIDELIRYVGEVNEDTTLRREDALWARVRLLDGEARQLLEVVCVGGYPLRLETAAAAAGLGGKDWAKSSAVLRLANFVRTTGSRANDTIEVHHDRVRDAVLERLNQKRRAELHQRIAEELEADGVAAQNPHLVLQHFEACGDRQRAAELAVMAAERATEGMAFDRAAELYRSLLSFGHSDPSAVQRDLAQALTHAGRGLEAAQVYLDLSNRLPQAQRVDCQRQAAREFLRSGQIERGLEVLTELLDPAQRSNRSRLMLPLQRVQQKMSAIDWTARPECEVAPLALRRHDVLSSVTSALALIEHPRAAEFHTRSVAAARQIGEPRRLARSLAGQIIFNGAKSHRNAKNLAEIAGEVIAMGVASNDNETRSWATLVEGTEHFFVGRFDRAAESLEAAVAAGATGSDLYYQATAQLYRLSALRMLGRLSDLRRDFDRQRADAERRGDHYLHRLVATFANSVWLLDDQVERARRELGRGLSPQTADGVHLEHWFQLRSLLEINLYTGTAEALAEYLPRLELIERSPLFRLQEVRAEFAWLTGRVALTHGDGKIAERMADKLEREDQRYAQVWSDLLRAGAAHRRNEQDRAVGFLRAAITVAEANQLQLFAAAAQARLGAILGNDEGRELVRVAHAWFATQSVKNVSRLMALYVP